MKRREKKKLTIDKSAEVDGSWGLQDYWHVGRCRMRIAACQFLPYFLEQAIPPILFRTSVASWWQCCLHENAINKKTLWCITTPPGVGIPTSRVDRFTLFVEHYFVSLWVVIHQNLFLVETVLWQKCNATTAHTAHSCSLVVENTVVCDTQSILWA